MHVVAEFTLGTSEAHSGCGNIVFGWVAFICSVLATVDLLADVAVLMTVEHVQSEAEPAAANKEKATGDWVDSTDARVFTNAESPLSNMGRSHVQLGLETQPIDAGLVPGCGSSGKELFTVDSALGPPPVALQHKGDWKKDVAITGATVAEHLAQDA